MTRYTIGSVSLAVLALLATAPSAFAAADVPLSAPPSPIAAPNVAPHVSLPVKMLNPPAAVTAAPAATPAAGTDWKAVQGRPASANAAPVTAQEPVNTYSAAKPALAADKPLLAAEAVTSVRPAPAMNTAAPVKPATAAAALPAPSSLPARDTASATRATASVPTAVPAPAKPQVTLTIDIDLSRQRMSVVENGQQVGTWAISSGREGFRSPTGTYRPLWSAKMWFSKKYDNAPMPNAVFFSGGVAMHATQATGLLGQPASHGCIRQSPANAATTYRLVAKHGNAHTKISVHGTPHDSESRIANRDRSGVQVSARQGRAVDRHSQMRRVIVVDGSGNRRIAEIPANDPRLVAYQNRQQGSHGFW